MKRKRGTGVLGIVRKFFPNVNKVTDADDDLVVEVTAQDVKHSSKKDHIRCAMAVATQRQLHSTGMIVSPSMAYVVTKKHAVRFRLPEAIRKEIVSFDRGAGFEPGQYKLEKPPKSARLGSRSERTESKSKNHSSSGKKRFVHLTQGLRTSIRSKAL